MAKLCRECQDKKPDTSVRGSCQAVSYIPNAQLPPKHQPWTDSANISLCEACADHYNICSWCWGPLDGGPRVTVPTDKKFCRAFEQDNGNHIEGMYVGEQIVAQLSVDIFSGLTWQPKRLSPGVRHVASRMVPQGQQAILEMYFDLNRADAKAEIELEEVASRWWVTPSGKTWKVTVEILN